MTSVVSVRGRNRDELLAEPGFVYVGRAVGRAGWKQSIFANPYPASKFHRDNPHGAVEWFLEDIVNAVAGRDIASNKSLCGEPVWFNGVFQVMAEHLHELRGKKLGCWCGFWRPGQTIIPCHAAVLACVAEGIPLDWEVIRNREVVR